MTGGLPEAGHAVAVLRDPGVHSAPAGPRGQADGRGNLGETLDPVQLAVVLLRVGTDAAGVGGEDGSAGGDGLGAGGRAGLVLLLPKEQAAPFLLPTPFPAVIVLEVGSGSRKRIIVKK